jgi:protein O-mannosyl-transferase
VALALGAFGLVAAWYLGPRFLSLMSGDFARRGFTPVQRLLTEGRVVVHYLTLLAAPLPWRLNLDYDVPVSRSLLDPPSTACSVAVLLALAAFGAWQWRRNRLVSFAVLWFLGNLAIESTLVPLDLQYEHRLYLPSMLPCLLAAGALLGGAPVSRRRWSVLGVVALALAAFTVERNRLWADPVLLFSDNAAKSPQKGRVLANLGLAFADRGDREQARAAFERAVALDPEQVGAGNNLALLLLDLGQAGQARKVLELTLERHPRDAGTHANLGVVCSKLRDHPAAVRSFETAVALDANDPYVVANLVIEYLQVGDRGRARATLDHALARWPDDPTLRGVDTASRTAPRP